MPRPLVFELKVKPELAMDLSPLTPDALAGKTLDKIKNIRLESAKKKIRVSDLFKVTGTDSENILIKNSDKKLEHIGEAMSFGSIEVQGPVGHFAGSKMSGGQLSIRGAVGDFLGANMKNGRIEVKGNAGNFVGAGRTGQMQGMNGGLITISGHAGDRVADRMRRGTIFIGKNAGDYCGSRMIAGTVIVMGETGAYSGYAMKRGTIILTIQPNLPATFKDCGELELGYLNLLFKQFAQMGQPLSKLNQYSPKAIRYAGDLANKGLGEILLLQ